MKGDVYYELLRHKRHNEEGTLMKVFEEVLKVSMLSVEESR